MRRTLITAALITCAACHANTSPTPGEYLFVWAGDSAGKASDFLAVIDAAPSSSHYGSVVASLPTGVAATHPHHTEAELAANGHLLANGFGAGRTWLYDLSVAREPKILTSFGDLAGFSHPHAYIRLANGNVLATFQYKADSTAPGPVHGHGEPVGAKHTTGGLVEMDERGGVIQSGSASDPAIRGKQGGHIGMISERRQDLRFAGHGEIKEPCASGFMKREAHNSGDDSVKPLGRTSIPPSE